LLLIVSGLLFPHLAHSAALVRGTRLLWIYSGFANWLGCFYGAWAGAGTMTPVASAGRQGSALDEAIVSFLLISVAVTAVLAVGLTLYGPRAHVCSN
jgi:hydroxylaminobenzene mutase